MRSSDWSSDVCSSDLPNGFGYENTVGLHGLAVYGPNATLERCKLRGFRYDSLYGRVDVNVNGGWATFRAIGCDFGDRSAERSVGKAFVSTCRSRVAL